jgi:acetyl esterase/lipase
MDEKRVLLWPNGAPGAKGDGVEDRPAITPYLAPGNEPTPAVVICPGGGYARRAAHEGEPIARWLNSIGFSAFVLDYRVAPYQHPYPLADVQRALRFVRFHAAEWGIDQEQLGVLGFSAGGHLASTAATLFTMNAVPEMDAIDALSCRPDFAVLCYPVISSGAFKHSGSIRNLLGEQPDASLLELLSTDKRVTEQTPPTFLWHTASDTGVPVENSILFAQALSAHKVPFALHIFPYGRHGLGLAADTPQVQTWPMLCAAWLKEVTGRL